MGEQSTTVDMESLQRSRRQRCLHTFFIMAILFLFVALTSVTVCGVMVVMELQTEIRNSNLRSGSNGDSPQTYKMQNFAYLGVKSSELELNSTMKWVEIHHGEGKSVGSLFTFDPELNSLTPAKEGNYFIYINLNLTCTHKGKCKAGLLSLRVDNKLTCDVELPSNTTSVKTKCWTVARLNKEKLLTHVTVPKEGFSNWILELTGSGLGMFLVD